MSEASGSDQPKENGPSERGTQYPGDNLESAIAMLEKVRGAVGFSPAQREIIAQALGYKSLSGHAARRLGSLSHFDLLERSGKGAARISPLGRSILMPTSAEERREAIVEAARRPNLYAALIAKYAGHALPTLLPNLLIREHGVHPSVADGAATAFRETVEFAGLMRNGVLYAEPEADPAAPAPSGHSSSEQSVAHKGYDAAASREVIRSSEKSESEITGFTIPLDNSGRMATIRLPLPVTARDLKKLGAWLTYMNAVIEVEEETSGISAN